MGPLANRSPRARYDSWYARPLTTAARRLGVLDTLSREAFTLARLDLSEEQITAALLPAFVGAAGERREYEGRRTIRDAVHARGQS